MGRFDVILLRHVLTAWTPSLHGKVVENLVALLPDDGVLVLSPEDDVSRVRGLAADHGPAPAIYRRASAVGPAKPPPSAFAVAREAAAQADHPALDRHFSQLRPR
jgi:hypothetical protein